MLMRLRAGLYREKEPAFDTKPDRIFFQVGPETDRRIRIVLPEHRRTAALGPQGFQARPEGAALDHVALGIGGAEKTGVSGENTGKVGTRFQRTRHRGERPFGHGMSFFGDLLGAEALTQSEPVVRILSKTGDSVKAKNPHR